MNPTSRLRPNRVLAALVLLSACEGNDPEADPTTAPPALPQYVERTAGSGIDFVHVHGGSGQKFFIETNGSGAGFFDYDGDGDLDLYAVQAGALPGYADPGPFTNRLYRNDGGFRFTDVTEAAGVGDEGYGMGCLMGDYDADGDDDLFVYNWGPNVMYRNNGDGTFDDVTAELGLGDDLYGGTAVYADFDQDGDLDLFLGNYVTFRIEDHEPCEHPPLDRSYCHPDVYAAQPDRFYRNDQGRFVECAEAIGITRKDGKALGSIISDVDNDGDLDLFVANDSTPNHLYRNDSKDGALRFTDISNEAGISYDQSGRTQGSMGVDFDDVDGDYDFDLIVTNFMWETNALYINDGRGFFEDECMRRGVGKVSYLDFGWGARFLDFDLDGDRDLLVVNGHLHDKVHIYDANQQYEQSPRLFLNDGAGNFTEIGERGGPFFSRKIVARGLAMADLDDDGDLDAFVNTNNHAALLLECQGKSGNHWVGLRLRGRGGNHAAIGARVELASGERKQVQEVRGAGSFASFSDLRLIFGLGAERQIEPILVRWPDGTREEFAPLAVDRYHEIVQGTGR